MEEQAVRQGSLAIYEDEFDALRDAVQKLGGTKAVGHALRPDLGPLRAADWLKDCLNPERRERLSLTQMMKVMRMAHDINYHAPAQYLAGEMGYKMASILAGIDCGGGAVAADCGAAGAVAGAGAGDVCAGPAPGAAGAHEPIAVVIEEGLRVGHRVVTPSDSTAFVERIEPALDGGAPEVTVRYAGALNPASAQVTVRAPLLVRWVNEMPRPKPVRRGW